jgi:hypothetical protein
MTIPSVVYQNDHRYPPPNIHQAPESIEGLPTVEELDAFPRMFTWGELKEIVSEWTFHGYLHALEMKSIWSWLRSRIGINL